MKIVLSMISGPEGETLARCIRSFAPAIDGVSIAFGSGNQDCSATQELIIATCQELNLSLTSEHYTNAPAHADWPHIDDFAAARNLSLNNAIVEFSPDWIIWADADDVLPAPACAVLRDICSRAEPSTQAIWSPYVLGADGRHVKRERIVRPGHHWKNRVHEHIDCLMEKSLFAAEIQIQHTPAINKTGSHARNLRILESIPEAERTGREWFYIHEESAAMSRTALALAAGIEATGRSDVKPAEKYSIYMRIGSWMRDKEAAERSVMECIRLDPSRRDAFALLGKLNLEENPDRALHFFRAMSGVAFNENDNPALHRWQARDLEWLALARLGQDVSSQRQALFREHGRQITVIHPTCRPDQAIRRREEWLSKAEHPEAIEYIFGASESDPDVVEALRGYPLALAGKVPEGYSTAVVNHNAAAAASTGKIVIVAQDDIHPCEGWDMMVRSRLQPHMKQPRVLHIHDGHREDQIMVIMCVTRAWLHAHGNVLLCPEYDGYFSDTEYSLRCYSAGQVVDGRDIRFFHNHPLFTGAPSDDSYMRQQNPVAYARGKEIFDRRNPAPLTSA
ncbi:MAG: hypothetical protein ACOYNN_04150 [Terrimicrobiaceae bacterium]